MRYRVKSERSFCVVGPADLLDAVPSATRGAEVPHPGQEQLEPVLVRGVEVIAGTARGAGACPRRRPRGRGLLLYRASDRVVADRQHTGDRLQRWEAGLTEDP